MPKSFSWYFQTCTVCLLCNQNSLFMSNAQFTTVHSNLLGTPTTQIIHNETGRAITYYVGTTHPDEVYFIIRSGHGRRNKYFNGFDEVPKKHYDACRAVQQAYNIHYHNQ